jgi:hypothetical protein
MWISGNRNIDILIFHLSGLLGLALYMLFKQNNLALIFYGFLIIQLFDAGHNYVTVWRTFIKRVNNLERFNYFLLFLFCFLIILFWLTLRIPEFWTFFLYFTFFHHIRQYYGICRWYQKLNNRYCKISNLFLYSLTIIPFILFHFRNLPKITNYSKISLFQFPSQNIFFGGLAIYFLIFLAWIFHEINILKNNKWEINRFLSILMPVVLHFICFLICKDILQILLPLFLVHGLSYLFITGITLEKLENKKHAFLPIIFITALIFGFADYLYRILILHENYNYLTLGKPFDFIILALITTPALFHYFTDGLLWTGKNKDMKMIFSEEIK